MYSALRAHVAAVERGEVPRPGVPAGARIGVLAGADGRIELEALGGGPEVVVVASSPRDLSWKRVAPRVIRPADFLAEFASAEGVRRIIFDDAGALAIPAACSALAATGAFVWLVCEPEGMFRGPRARTVADVLVSHVLRGVAGPIRAEALRNLIVRATTVRLAGIRCGGYSIPPRHGAGLRRRLRAIDAAQDPRPGLLRLMDATVAVDARADDIEDDCMVCLEPLFRRIHAGVPSSHRLREPATRLVGCCGKVMCASCFLRWSVPAARCPACRTAGAARGAVLVVHRERVAERATPVRRLGPELHVFPCMHTVRDIAREDPHAARLDRWHEGHPAARALASPACLELALQGPTVRFARAVIHVLDPADALSMVARTARLARTVRVFTHSEKIICRKESWWIPCRPRTSL